MRETEVVSTRKSCVHMILPNFRARWPAVVLAAALGSGCSGVDGQEASAPPPMDKITTMALAGAGTPLVAEANNIQDGFDQERAERARGLAATAASSGRGDDAILGYLAAIQSWPADAGPWQRLAELYARAKLAEGAVFARFFAARLDVLNRLHPRAAAAALDGFQPPTSVRDPEVRAAYARSAALLLLFYRSRYEDVRFERATEAAAKEPFITPYLAYPAAAVTAGVVVSTFYRFAIGIIQK